MNMNNSILIKKLEDGYVAELKAKSDSGDFVGLWVTANPLSKELLNASLLSLGFNQRDIYDAFDIADGTTIDPTSESGERLIQIQKKLGHFV